MRYPMRLLLAATVSSSIFAASPPRYLDPSQPVDARVSDLLSRMTLQEKVNQLLHPWPGPETTCDALVGNFSATGLGAVYAGSLGTCNGLTTVDAINFVQGTLINTSRLGIPVAMVPESLHSSVNGGTIFPNPTLLGQTWDVALLEDVGTSIGRQARANGITRGFGPVLQVVTDPRFGRYEEALSEDPYLVGVMGAAMIRGQQGAAAGPSVYVNDTAHISLEAKHAISYASSGRDWYRTDVTFRTLMDVYAKPWRAAIRAGLKGFMAMHAEVAGLPMHGNGPLIAGVMRGVLGGAALFAASDSGDINGISRHGITTDTNSSAVYALTAGMDQELVTQTYPSLVDSVTRGIVDVAYVDAAVTRLLREKFALRLFDGPAYWLVDPAAAAAALDTPADRALAYRAATEGAVLLRNEPGPGGKPLLPLVGLGTTITRIALVGPNCADEAAWHGGYSNDGADIRTLLTSLRNNSALNVTFVAGADMLNATNTSGIPAAVAAALAAQVTIACVGDTTLGYGRGTCAEGIDADTIDLPGSQLALLAALADAGVPLVTVGIHGRPFTLGAGPTSSFGANNGLLDRLPALVAAYRPGEAGGDALVDLLTGSVNFAGRLTAGWVRHVGALRGPANPYFQARGANNGKAYVTEPATALFPFGFGLAYNTPAIASARLAAMPIGRALAPGDVFTVEGMLDNAGPAGVAVLQIYFSQDAPTKWVRYESQLIAFARVPLPADAKAVPFSVPVAVDDTDGYDEELGRYVVYTGNYTFYVGLDSASFVFTFPKVPVNGTAWTRPSFPGAPTRA